MKKYLIWILLLVLLCGAALFLKNNIYMFLYMNSANNADAYPYIANTTKKLDCAVKKTDEILSGLNVKTLYTKASGDGFVKNNVFAKDLNYEAGIYLGQYNDTKNILQNIKIYQTFLINSLGDMNVQVTKTAKNNDKINLPENSNTIFITPEYKIKLYSKDIAYSKDSRKILQNLNFSLVYYADINNKHYRLMEYPAAEESRFSVYTGLNSLDYINKNIESLPYDVLHKDSEFDFIIYAMKQTTDIEITNSALVLLNDYYKANETLLNILNTKAFAKKMEKEIKTLVKDMERILADMINESNMTYNELKPLFNYQSELGGKNVDELRTIVQNNKIDEHINNLVKEKTDKKFEKVYGNAAEKAGIHFNIGFLKGIGE